MGWVCLVGGVGLTGWERFVGLGGVGGLGLFGKLVGLAVWVRSVGLGGLAGWVCLVGWLDCLVEWACLVCWLG